MSKFARKGQVPQDFGVLEPTLDALDNELRRVTVEKKSGRSKNESTWPVVQLSWQRTKYVHDMFYKHHKISQTCFDYCARNNIIDKALSDKWLEPGYNKLCCMQAIDTSATAFGTVCK